MTTPDTEVTDLEGGPNTSFANVADLNAKLTASEQTVARLQTELEAMTKERDALKAADRNFNTRLAAEVAKHGIRSEAIPMPGMAANPENPSATNWTERALAHLRASGKAV